MGITKEMWQAALLGAVVSAVFAGTINVIWRILEAIRRLSSLRQLLGPIADKETPVMFFTKHLYSKDRIYYSDQPDYFPPRTQGKKSKHPNIPLGKLGSEIGVRSEIGVKP